MAETHSIARSLNQLRHALLFLTRIPVGRIRGIEDMRLADAAWAFPIVGVVVGGLSGGALYVAADTALHPLACAVIALVVQAWVTGALHEDGLADVADGMGAHGKKRALEIMRDSRIGAFGVLGLIFSVGLRAAALASIPGPGLAWGALIAAAALSRAVLPIAMLLVGQARVDGRAAEAGQPNLLGVLLAMGIASAALMLGLAGWVPVLAIVVALPAGGWVLYWAHRKLGGITGDVLGALQQVTEIAVLLAAAAWTVGYL